MKTIDLVWPKHTTSTPKAQVSVYKNRLGSVEMRARNTHTYVHVNIYINIYIYMNMYILTHGSEEGCVCDAVRGVHAHGGGMLVKDQCACSVFIYVYVTMRYRRTSFETRKKHCVSDCVSWRLGRRIQLGVHLNFGSMCAYARSKHRCVPMQQAGVYACLVGATCLKHMLHDSWQSCELHGQDLSLC